MPNELVFIGLGLQDELGISLRGLEEAKSCDRLFAEFYTNLMPGLTLQNLQRILGKQVRVLTRKEVEDQAEELIVSKAKAEKVGFIVPGDPMVATTHVDLRLRAHRAGIKTRIIHAASVGSAVAGATGLQSYKFGRTITIPATLEGEFPESIYLALKSNLESGLHTLLLLEIDVENKRHVTIPQALDRLLAYAQRRPERLVTPETLVVGVARLESSNMILRAGTVNEIVQTEFGGPPYTLVIPGPLHFMEAEALQAFCGADAKLVGRRP
jgi:diphthine synthase